MVLFYNSKNIKIKSNFSFETEGDSFVKFLILWYGK